MMHTLFQKSFIVPTHIVIRFFSLVFTISVLISCEKTDPDKAPDEDYNYFPLKVGQSVTFDVRQEIYSAGVDAPGNYILAGKRPDY